MQFSSQEWFWVLAEVCGKLPALHPRPIAPQTQTHAICKRIDQTGSAVQRKPVSGRAATARTADTIEKVDELICSQDGESGTHRSTREIAAELNISQSSVCRIAKRDLRLKSFRRVPTQVINDST